MSAAARLRRLDENAQITVLERGPYVSFANCGLPYFVGGEIEDTDALLLQTPQSLRAGFDLDVRINHEVIGLAPLAKTVQVATPEGEIAMPYDQLILAPGADPVAPPIEGLDSPRCHYLRTVDDAVRVRDKVDGTASQAVVLGAGFIGLEAAEALRHRGLEVTVVEATDHILPPAEIEMANLLADELRGMGLVLREGILAKRIEDQSDGCLVHLSNGEAVPADLVVVSTGIRPATAVFEATGLACDKGAIVVDQHGRTNLPDVFAAGDAVVSQEAVTGAKRPVPLAGPANRAGRLIADAIAAPSARPQPQPLGTAIVRIGELTCALTGANRAALVRAGRQFTTVHLHPLNHAGYFPGAKRLDLMVHFDPVSGELLGAQCVGQNGADKRIDVIATAMRGGLKAADLMDLDLCYSPPYGSARDAITMVGLLADNVMTGQTTLWQPEQLAWARSDETLLLDVRSPAEFATGHLPEATNIPHTKLRGRLDEVRAAAEGRPIAVMCQSGVRSYIAHRILVGAGFDSSTLSGGMLTLRAYLGKDAESVLVK